MGNVGDWVAEITTTAGQGNIIFGGVAAEGYTKFSTIGDGPVWYSIVEGSSRESGLGTLSGNTLVRGDVHATLVDGVYSDTGVSPIVLYGSATVYCTFNKVAFKEFTEGLETLATALQNDTGLDLTASDFARLSGEPDFTNGLKVDGLGIKKVGNKVDIPAGVTTPNLEVTSLKIGSVTISVVDSKLVISSEVKATDFGRS